MQYILDQAIPDVVPRLAKKLAGHYTELSTGKFSSNVVEKVRLTVRYLCVEGLCFRVCRMLGTDACDSC